MQLCNFCDDWLQGGMTSDFPSSVSHLKCVQQPEQSRAEAGSLEHYLGVPPVRQGAKDWAIFSALAANWMAPESALWQGTLVVLKTEA